MPPAADEESLARIGRSFAMIRRTKSFVHALRGIGVRPPEIRDRIMGMTRESFATSAPQMRARALELSARAVDDALGERWPANRPVGGRVGPPDLDLGPRAIVAGLGL